MCSCSAMRACNTLLFLATLAWVCQGGEAVGEQDCDQDMEECYERFQASANSDQCSAYWELMSCTQGVRDEEDCNNVQSRFEDRLRVIMDRYDYSGKLHSGNADCADLAMSVACGMVAYQKISCIEAWGLRGERLAAFGCDTELLAIETRGHLRWTQCPGRALQLITEDGEASFINTSGFSAGANTRDAGVTVSSSKSFIVLAFIVALLIPIE